jgi:hypothetical protein
MYVGVGNGSDSGANRARFYRTDDATGAAVFTDMTTAQNIGYCDGQCWYDNVVYTPAGAPDVVYVGGSFDYNNLHGRDNGRAWLLSPARRSDPSRSTRHRHRARQAAAVHHGL